ncbi:hypothetical protein [Streptomyces sp. NPDC050535]|uniref:hypothetical protein n=1 Tax=Streptomyces sp. NPDC050535 TaxID=3365626 RepID=UPI0037B3430F
MSPDSARILRRKRVAELRQAEPELSHRDMGLRLGISKDTVRRDLDDLAATAAQSATGDAVGAELVAQSAPQVSEGGAPGVAQDAPRLELPRRMVGPLDGIDVRHAAALRRDLAILAQTGRSPEGIVHDAVLEMARHYSRALATGALPPGRPFAVMAMEFRALPALDDPAAPSGLPPGEGA